MTLKEFLQKQVQAQTVTFITAKAVKSVSSPGYHTEYETTSIRTAWDWLKNCGAFVEKFIVINPDHPLIDVTGSWGHHYQEGWLKCAMITTVGDLLTLYGENQGREMIKYYERKVRSAQEAK